MTEQTEAPARPLYDRLRRIQLDQGWTNVQLAERAGISRGTIDNWKTQPRPPQPSTVKDVAERLGIPYQEALTLAGIAVGDTPARPATEQAPTADDDGTVRLTVHVNPAEPEPDVPPGGLRTQAERIIWAMTDHPWQIRWAQIKAARDYEAATREPAAEETRTAENRS